MQGVRQWMPAVFALFLLSFCMYVSILAPRHGKPSSTDTTAKFEAMQAQIDALSASRHATADTERPAEESRTMPTGALRPMRRAAAAEALSRAVEAAEAAVVDGVRLQPTMD